MPATSQLLEAESIVPQSISVILFYFGKLFVVSKFLLKQGYVNQSGRQISECILIPDYFYQKVLGTCYSKSSLRPVVTPLEILLKLQNLQSVS